MLFSNSGQIVIVLTGTIIPNAIFTAHDNSISRRNEYLAAINFYKMYGFVYFLENSKYDLKSDPDFKFSDNVEIIKFSPSNFFYKGKGYQEFEMIDKWVSNLELPIHGFIKVSGRYIIKNFNELMIQCKGSKDFIIERRVFPNPVALTDVFYSTIFDYKKYILGGYSLCNDQKGHYIEHVVYDALSNCTNVRLFKKYPIRIGRSGSTGSVFKINVLSTLKNTTRNILHMINARKRLF